MLPPDADTDAILTKNTGYLPGNQKSKLKRSLNVWIYIWDLSMILPLFLIMMVVHVEVCLDS